MLLPLMITLPHKIGCTNWSLPGTLTWNIIMQVWKMISRSLGWCLGSMLIFGSVYFGKLFRSAARCQKWLMYDLVLQNQHLLPFFRSCTGFHHAVVTSQGDDGPANCTFLKNNRTISELEKSNPRAMVGNWLQKIHLTLRVCFSPSDSHVLFTSCMSPRS